MSRNRLVLLTLVGSLAGCGTVENLAHVEQPTRPFGGVAADFTACREIVSPASHSPTGISRVCTSSCQPSKDFVAASGWLTCRCRW